MTKLWLIRHAETEHNANGIIQGQYDADLSERGRKQAARLAKRLASDPPDVIYSSDSSRAHDTARAVAEVCGLPIHLEPRLREVDTGTWSNHSWREIQRLYPDQWEQLRSGDPHFRRGGAENAFDVQERMVEALREIVAAHEGKRIAVFSHGFAIRTYLAHLLDLPLTHIASRFSQKNTCINRIEPPQNGRHGRLLTLNDTCHLKE